MFSFRAAIVTLALASATAASGQQLYKTVGADGKITFSDRPAVESAAQLSVMRSNTLRPVKGVGREPEPKEAAPPSAARPVLPITQVSPQVESALVSVMVQAEFGRRFYRFCNATPEHARAFTKAAAGWKERNRASVDQQRRLLNQVVAPGQRAEILEKVNAMLADESAKVAGKPPAEQAQWCAGAIAGMSSTAADADHQEMMAVMTVPASR